MNNTIIYCPYRFGKFVLPFTIPFGILFLVLFGYGLPILGFGALVYAAMGIGCIWLTKVCYDFSRIAVFFEQEGLRIVGGGYKDYRYVRWEELSYAYYARSFKGHTFSVLSPRELSRKEAKALANRCANSLRTRICIDDAVIIPLDPIQDVSQLTELIDNHLLHIDVN